MTLAVRMADSVSPWLIPEVFRQKPNGVAAYADGTYKWSAGMYAQFPRKRSITTDPADPRGSHAAIIDVERGDYTSEDVPGFYRKRKAASGDAQVIVYCDRSTVESVIEFMRDAGEPDQNLLWWIAWPLAQPPTAEQVSDELRQHWGAADLVTDDIWACQWRYAGNYDESVVYGPTEWMTT